MAAFCYTMRMNLKVPLLALAAIKPDDVVKRGHVKLIERAS